MELSTIPEFLIGQMRVQTMREQPFFYVISRPATMDGLDKELDLLMPKLQAAQADTHVGDGAPVVIRFFPTDTPPAYLMEVGLPVRAGTPRRAKRRSRRCRFLIHIRGSR